MGLLKPSGSLEDKLLGTTTQGTLAPPGKAGEPACENINTIIITDHFYS